jgi:hypothetical protein
VNTSKTDRLTTAILNDQAALITAPDSAKAATMAAMNPIRCILKSVDWAYFKAAFGPNLKRERQSRIALFDKSSQS